MGIVSYANTSNFMGNGWCPSITGYDANDKEYFFELDLTEGALKNWNDFKMKYKFARNRNEFFAEYKEAKNETEYMSKRTR